METCIETSSVCNAVISLTFCSKSQIENSLVSAPVPFALIIQSYKRRLSVANSLVAPALCSGAATSAPLCSGRCRLRSLVALIYKFSFPPFYVFMVHEWNRRAAELCRVMRLKRLYCDRRTKRAGALNANCNFSKHSPHSLGGNR